jgi:hypothetical protein
VASPYSGFSHRMSRCVFYGNRAIQGSVFGANQGYWGGPVAFDNCLLYSNTATTAATKYTIYVPGQRESPAYGLDVSHCTVIYNNGGLYNMRMSNSNREMRVRSSIVAFNGGYGIYADGGGAPVIQNCDLYGNATNYAGAAAAGPGCISVDPQFVGAVTNDYRLAISSPCVDAGTNTGLTLDLIGTMRPTRNGYDMGCYEERGASRIVNLMPATTTSNAVLRGQMVYDGQLPTWTRIYWGPTDGGTNAAAWANTNEVGYVAMPNMFSFTNTVINGQSYFFRCFASNAYAGVWADASMPFDASLVYLWMGAGTNSLASNPANWQGNVAPNDPAGTIKLDNICSNMTWDAAALHTVWSWVQTANYTGIVTIATGWTNGFGQLTVSSDMTLNGGKLTHLANASQEVFRLALDVGGNFILAAAAGIDVDGKGYAATKGPGGATVNLRAGSHGGQGYFGTGTPTVYGDLCAPTNLGSGGFDRSGGGAVWLTVGATGTVNGLITAGGQDCTGNDQDSGAGGSIFLRAGTVAGNGTLRACAALTDSFAGTHGSGGRVALIVTNDTGFGNLTLRAGSTWNGFGCGGGAGTIYKQSTLHAPNKGILVFDNYSYNQSTANYNVRWAVTPLPTNYPLADFAQVVLTNAAVLGILPGQSFNFGTDLANIRFAGAGIGGCYITVRNADGVTFPSPFTISNYTLRLDTPVARTGDWIVAAGGVLSHSWNESSADLRLDLNLTGNLTVRGAVDVTGAGYSYRTGPGYVNAGIGSSHGGVGNDAPTGKTYGAIFYPTNLGSGAYYVQGGGAMRLAVSGNTAVDGGILANSLQSWSDDGSGGSIYLRTATLSGTGVIAAVGGVRSSPGNQEEGGGGGRVSVKLTSATNCGAVTVTAQGGCAGSNNTNKTGSAGSVYIETAADMPGGGRLIIDNARLPTNRPTGFPASGSATEDLRRVTMVITNGAWMQFTTNVTVGGLYLAAGTRLDLNGYTGKVASLTISNRSLTGSFTASQLGPIVSDSSGGNGRLIAPAPGLVLTMR